MKTILAFIFLLFPVLAYAQIPTCTVALTASPQGPFPCSVTVTWTDNADNETGYRLERRLNNSTWGQIGGTLAVNTTSVIDATLQQSAAVDNFYEYRVLAVNSAGTAPSINPAIAGFTVPKATSPPKPATGITVTFKGATGILLCPTCTGGDKKVPFSGDEGTFEIIADEITVALK